MENNITVKQNQIPEAVTLPGMSALGIFGDTNSFNIACRASKAFAESTIVPTDYRGKEANCLIAIDMASRLGVSPLMVMQQLYIVNGRPAWSSQFLVAMINTSKKFKTPIQYDLGGSGDNMQCYAWVIDKNGERLCGPTITIKMANDEGWTTKNGSKWKTMPEVMLRYRAASFFARLHCSDLTMGFYTDDEAYEMDDYKEYKENLNTTDALIGAEKKLQNEINNNANMQEMDFDVTPDGEVIDAQPTAPNAPQGTQIQMDF